MGFARSGMRAPLTRMRQVFFWWAWVRRRGFSSFCSVPVRHTRGRVAFGMETDTLDASGRVIRSCQMELTRDQVVDAARAMTGEIDQVPPMVSALKVDGRRLYEIARSGKEVERSSRKVRVRRFDIESFDAGEESGFPSATVLVECSSGTYVRSLAADLGAALGGCAHLAELRRLSVGSFTLKEARSMDEIEADPGAALKSCREAVRDLVQATANERQAMEIGHGAVFPAGTIVKDDSAGPTAVVGPDGELLAVYEGAARRRQARGCSREREYTVTSSRGWWSARPGTLSETDQES